MSERDAEYTADQPAVPMARLTDKEIAWYRENHRPVTVKAHDGSDVLECFWCEDSDDWPCSPIRMVEEIVAMRGAAACPSCGEGPDKHLTLCTKGSSMVTLTEANAAAGGLPVQVSTAAPPFSVHIHGRYPMPVGTEQAIGRMALHVKELYEQGWRPGQPWPPETKGEQTSE
jgi:hypothetical protein